MAHFVTVCGICLSHAFALAGQAANAERPAAKPNRPNIVVFVADDIGWKDIGYHDSDIRTPNLDRMAQSGVRLEQFYVSPMCTPTRAALMTGVNPSRFNILGAFSVPKSPNAAYPFLPRTVPTLAERLKRVGYKTAIVGKWHLSGELAKGPRQYGFDHTYGYLHGHLDPLTHRCKNGDPTWHRNDEFVEEEGHVTDLITREAIKVIEQYQKEPFFLYVPFHAVHVPINEPDKWVESYGTSIANESRRRYAAAASHMDDAIGQVVNALYQRDLLENTMVVFFSDNGGLKQWSSKTDYDGRYPPHDRLGDNRPLRGWKSEMYEGGIRVPAFIFWPKQLPARVVGEVTSVLDLFPTIIGLAGGSEDGLTKAEENRRLEGVDLWPLLIGKGAVGPRELYWRNAGKIALRYGDWKLIKSLKSGPNELFNIAADPSEKTDLAEEEPERVQEMLGRIEQQRKRDAAKL